VKKLLFAVLCLLAPPVYAQFTPGQILTAAELNSQFALYAPLTGATYTGPVVGTSFSGAFTGTTTTQGRLDNSTSLATDAFVNQQNASAVATVNFAGVTGGVYNQATLGSGCQVVVFASGGVITSSLTISNPGSGYQVGDLLAVPAGNSDAVLRVTGVSSGGVTSVGIANGGTGYVTGQVATAMAVPPGRRAVNFTGTLTSNLTFIIQNGAYLTASREIEFINNTTGGFTITVYLSNGADGHTGNGVVLPQGSNNSTAVSLYTDGVNDVWLANSPAGIGVSTTYAPINSPTFTGTVTIPSGASISGYLTTANAASTYAPIASPTFTGTVTIPSGASISGYLTTVSAASTYLPLAGGTLSGALTAPSETLTNSLTGGATLTVSSASNTGNGASITLIGNGATTPTKTIRAFGGQFQWVNSASTTIIGYMDDTGDLNVNGSITPSQTAGIVGTTTNNNANSGTVGEFQTATTSSTAVTSGISLNCTSVSLTAGDWDVSGTILWTPASGTTPTTFNQGINTTSAVLAGLGTATLLSATYIAGANVIELSTPVVRESLSATTTVYLVGQAAFTGSTMTCGGYIRARRVR
jgi:hypothetical protein